MVVVVVVNHRDLYRALSPIRAWGSLACPEPVISSHQGTDDDPR